MTKNTSITAQAKNETEKIVPLPDSLSEYYRECMYCKKPFTANHQLRRFCTSKNGIPNYCKNRYKVLLQGARIAGENVVTDHKEDFPTPNPSPTPNLAPTPAPALTNLPPKAFDGLVTLENIKEWEATAQAFPDPEVISKNKQILNELLADEKQKKISLKTIIDLGIDFRVYDFRKQLPRCDLYYIEIGIYALFWTQKNEILITPITEILWM